MKIESLEVQILLLLLILCSLSVPIHAQKGDASLAVEDVVKTRLLRSNAPVDLSPDGQWVAYTAQNLSKNRPNEEGALFLPSGTPVFSVGSEIEVANTESSTTVSIGGRQGSSWGPVWSPDGKYLAFYSDRNGKARLWIWEKLTGRLRQVSDVIVRALNPFGVVRWTPDSKKILVKVLPADLTIQEANEGTLGGPLSRQKSAGSLDSTVTVYSSGASATPAKPARNSSAMAPQDISNVFLSDLALIDITNGAVRRIAHKTKVRWYSVSPQGLDLAYAAYKGFKDDNTRQSVYDLVVVSLADFRARVVAPNIRLFEWGTAISWSPDGKLLAYTEDGPQATGECYIVPISGDAPRKATAMPHPRFDGHYRPPLWDRTGKSLYFFASNSLWKISVVDGTTSEVSKIPNRRLIDVISPIGEGRFWSPDGGRSMYVSTRNDDTKEAGFYKIDLSTGRFTRLLEEGKTYGSYLFFNVDVTDDKLIYRAEDVQHAADLWVSDPDFKSQKRVSRLNPQFDRYNLGRSELVEWTNADGEKLRGALLLPSDYEKGKKYPLVVWVYGGAFGSEYMNDFGLQFGTGVFNLQLLSTRGYAVLFPDAPLRVGTPMSDLAKAVLPGVDKVVELGIADPKRVGVGGWSYGGYSTLALIVQTTQFKAAVVGAHAGGNLFTSYGRLSNQGYSHGIAWSEESQGRMGGTPWEFRQRYIENSPLFYFDRVQTPVLILHGTVDTLPSFLSDEVFVALRRLGKEVTYAKYRGEGHAITAYGNQMDYLNRTIAWFDRWLQAP